ncbi:MAG TPA: LPS export ABC transporter permease LptG [Alphaproteobacteria bacterium]|nr:LPS export ABC transporter permease LptG [Alphaproteobacteria bacterium]
MRTSPTLSIYFGRQFLAAFGAILMAFVSVSFLFDLVETLRRANSKDNAVFSVVLSMSLFKLPHLTEQVIPFAVLFGAMLAFWRLTRSQELIVVRSVGVSVWQFIFPALFLAFLIGVAKITMLNPVASAMLFRYEELENKYLKGKTSMLSVSDTGFWLRENDPGGDVIVHALRVTSHDFNNFELHDVTFFRFGANDRFVGRIDATSARLKAGDWDLTNAWRASPDRPPRFEKTLRVPTELTFNEIQNSFASPESISFWDLPRFIDVLQRAGFSAQRHRLYWNSLLADPLLQCAMVLIAASFSLRHQRRGGTLLLIALGVFTGFLIYFLSDVVFALGLSATIPIFLAAWSPAGASTLLGSAVLFHLEDG